MKLKINPIALIVNLLFLFGFYLFNPGFNLFAFFKLIGFLILCYLTGLIILEKFNAIRLYSHVAQTGLAIFFGGTLYWFVFSCFSNLSIDVNFVYMFFVPILFFVKWKESISLNTSPNKYLIASILVLTIFQFYGLNTFETFSAEVVQRFPNFRDNFFYTSLVASLKMGSIRTSFFDVGAPMHYHIGGFFFPAVLSAITRISSHISNWVIFVPFVRFLSLLIMGETIAIVLIKFFSIKPKYFFLITFWSVILYLFTFPLNPKYVLTGDVKNFLWIGTGVTIPDMPALATGFLTAFWSIALFFDTQFLQTRMGKVMYVLITSSILVFKVTFFYAFLVFSGFYSLWIVLQHKQWNRFILTFVSALIASIWYILIFSGSGISIIKFEPFYLATYFPGHQDSIFRGSIIAIVVILVVWGGIKLFVDIIIPFLLDKKLNQKVIPFLSITVATLLFSAIPGFVFKIYNINEQGILWGDLSYDLLQFIKSGLVIFSFGSITIILLFLLLIDKKLWRTLLMFSLAGWSMLVLSSMITNNRHNYKNVSFKDNSWENEIAKTFENMEIDGLLAIRSSSEYSGQYIAANDVGPWYTCIIKKTGGVSLSSKNWNRQKLLIKLESESDITEKQKVLEKLKSENVKYIIATPENEETYKQLDSLTILNRLKNSNWIYELGD